MDKEHCGGWCRLVLKGLLLGQSHRCSVSVWGGGKGWFGMVETKCKSFYLRQGGPYFVPSWFAIAASMTCSERNLHPCSCYWVGAQSLLPP
jgi:hypothetical protein